MTDSTSPHFQGSGERSLLLEKAFLHRTYHRVLPSWVRLSFISVFVALGAGVALPGGRVPLWAGVAAGAGLPIGVHSPPSGFIVLSPSATCRGRGGNVLPLRCTVLLSYMGRRWVVALVAGRLMGLCTCLRERHAAGDWRVIVVAWVGGWLSWHMSGLGGVIIRIPPERETV